MIAIENNGYCIPQFMSKIQLYIGDQPGKIRLESISIPNLNTQLILAICSDMVASDARVLNQRAGKKCPIS